jgi:phosphonate transport system substrate-binding protein
MRGGASGPSRREFYRLIRPLQAAGGIGLCALLGVLLPGSPGRAEDAPLEFGLAPYISARPLLAMFQPMASFLEHQLGRKVLLVTAPSEREFDQRALAGGYELAMVAPQTARLAQKQAGYVPLLRVANDWSGLFLVSLDTPAKSLKDLAGQQVAFPDRFSATALLGREMVREAGLPESSIVYPPGSQDSLLVSLLHGDYPAVLVSESAFHSMPAEQKQTVHVLARTRQIPHVMFLARSDLSGEQRAAIRAAIEAFMASAEAGRRFIPQTGMEAVRPPTEAELKSLDALAQEQKRLLEEVRATRSTEQ